MGDEAQRRLRAAKDPEREAVGVALAKVRDLDAKLDRDGAERLTGAARAAVEDARAQHQAVIDDWRTDRLAKKAAKAAEKERENEGISTT